MPVKDIFARSALVIVRADFIFRKNFSMASPDRHALGTLSTIDSFAAPAIRFDYLFDSSPLLLHVANTCYN